MKFSYLATVPVVILCGFGCIHCTMHKCTQESVHVSFLKSMPTHGQFWYYMIVLSTSKLQDNELHTVGQDGVRYRVKNEYDMKHCKQATAVVNAVEESWDSDLQRANGIAVYRIPELLNTIFEEEVDTDFKKAEKDSGWTMTTDSVEN